MGLLTIGGVLGNFLDASAAPSPSSHLDVRGLSVGLGGADTTGITIGDSGRFIIYYDNTAINGIPALQTVSNRGGLKVTGHYFGMIGNNKGSGGLYGRVGILGQIDALNEFDDQEQARGYVGFLDTDPIPSGAFTVSTSFNSNSMVLSSRNSAPIPQRSAPSSPSFPSSSSSEKESSSSLPSSLPSIPSAPAAPSPPSMPSSIASSTNFPLWLPISDGTAWAFFTENTSRFINLTLSGVIAASDGTINIGSTAEPENTHFIGDIYLPADEMNVITVPHLDLTVSNYDQNLNSTSSNKGILNSERTDFFENDLNNEMVFTVFNSDSTTTQPTSLSNDDLIAIAQCPEGAVRIFCNGWVQNVDTVASIAPYRGTKPLGPQSCQSYARKFTGSNHDLYVQATCLAGYLPSD